MSSKTDARLGDGAKAMQLCSSSAPDSGVSGSESAAGTRMRSSGTASFGNIRRRPMIHLCWCWSTSEAEAEAEDNVPCSSLGADYGVTGNFLCKSYTTQYPSDAG